MATTTEVKHDEAVLVGPDINASRSPLDKKVYKQILLPNGLRACLISDTTAMNQIRSTGGMSLDSDEESGDEVDDDGGYDDTKKTDSVDDDGTDDEGSDDGSEGGDAGEASWLRDAACAVTVGVGSFADPPDCMGLAHFLGTLAYWLCDTFVVFFLFESA